MTTNENIYPALLEHMIRMSDNKLLIAAMKMAKLNPQIVMETLSINVPELKVIALFDGKHTSFIQCVKLYRSLTCEGLRESKEAVEKILGVTSIETIK